YFNMGDELFKTIEGESSKNLGMRFEKFCVSLLGEFKIWGANIVHTGINVTEVESTVRVVNLDIEGIRKEEFDAGFLVVLKCTRVRKIAFKIASLSKEKIIMPLKKQSTT
ncbi:9554_t:CDS:2, partial [Gigaspora margarita]